MIGLIITSDTPITVNAFGDHPAVDKLNLEDFWFLDVINPNKIIIEVQEVEE